MLWNLLDLLALTKNRRSCLRETGCSKVESETKLSRYLVIKYSLIAFREI